MQSRHFDAIVFSTKAAVSAVVAVLGYNLFGLPGAIWAAISAVLVTQPGLHPSLEASLIRVIANMLGAFVGVALSIIIGHSLAALAIGILLTGIICYVARLDDALRPAYAAVIIVIFTSGAGEAAWSEPLERVFAVIVGCVGALAVGLFYDKIARRIALRWNHWRKNKSSEPK